MANRYCLAEYCAGDFYMGWWLYERETNDGRRSRTNDDPWGWMRGDSLQRTCLWELCRGMGCQPPPLGSRSQAFAEWFAATFPNGLRVRVVEEYQYEGQSRYELIDIVKKRPRQRSGVVRTIRGAAMADRARKERNDQPK